MSALTLTKETFVEMLQGLVASGAGFTAHERNGNIEIVFTGAY